MTEASAPAENEAAPNETAVEEEQQTTDNSTETSTEQPVDDSPWADPSKAQAEIERLRRENANNRVNAKKQAAEEARQEMLKEFQKMLNPDAEQEAVSVEDLTKELTSERENARQAALELAVYKEASRDRLNADRILNSRSFFNKTKDLDPKSEDFGSKLAEVLQAEVKNDPTLKLTGGTTVSGAEQHGGSGEQQQTVTKEQFASMSVEQRTDLYRKNRALYDQLVAD